MKILITGASGNLGRLTRALFTDHEVHLFSRKKIATNKNERLILSKDLTNHEWWTSFEYLEHYDIIFHFAELVKVKISTKAKESIVISHLNFLTTATKNSNCVIYPMTAYKHDNKINYLHDDYLQIKTRVLKNLSITNNIKFPVFHPLIDYGSGLSKIIKLSKRIPFFNIFCSFQALLPVLYKSDLEKYIINVSTTPEKCAEVYSKILPISSIFNDTSKVNIALLSKIILKLMQILNHPNLQVLLNGRKI